METRISHVHRPKQIPSKKTTTTLQLLERERKKHQTLIRSFPLLLFTIFAATTILRLASSSSSSSSFVHPNLPSKKLQPLISADLSAMILARVFVDCGFWMDLAVIIETASKDSDVFKTHVSSKQSPLQVHQEKDTSPTICQALIDGKLGVSSSARDDAGILCCDRNHHRTDVCYMKGDIRTQPRSNAILLYGCGEDGRAPEKIKPYTRKWETPVMATIDELILLPIGEHGPLSNRSVTCDVIHDVPAVVLSTGGYTGNLYHEFNDGLIPLYLTTERFNQEVVLLMLEYHPWWVTKYKSLVKKMSNYELVDLRRDRRVHCFSEMIVGMRIHDELSIDPQLMPTGKGIRDFQSLLYQAFGSSHEAQKPHPLPLLPIKAKRPKIAIFVRNRSRVLLNLHFVIRRCRRIGFYVHILNPKRNTPLSQIHDVLSTSDVMLAVHGAAMTHFLFVRPTAALIQIVPLGLDWAAEEYYGRPAKKLGLEYMEYKLLPRESSLYREYKKNDPVIVDPESITTKGWQETKRIYLEHQNVTLDAGRFGKVLDRAYAYVHRGDKRDR